MTEWNLPRTLLPVADLLTHCDQSPALRNSAYCKLHGAALHSARCTVHISQDIVQTAWCILLTAQHILHTANYTQCILHSAKCAAVTEPKCQCSGACFSSDLLLTATLSNRCLPYFGATFKCSNLCAMCTSSVQVHCAQQCGAVRCGV